MSRAAKQDRISKKIQHLAQEGYPNKQAIAIALNMEREHRITKSGGYKRVKKR